jgi:hypothetical protein
MDPVSLNQPYLDANESVFFTEQLTHIKSRVYEREYPELKARKLFPVSYEAGPGAEQIGYDEFDRVGVAKIIANYADDLPMVDVTGERRFVRVRSIGDGYSFSIQDIRSAQMANRPLSAMKADAAREAYEQKLNKVAFFGDADYGIKGIFSAPNVPVAQVATGATSGVKNWSGKTADEILADLNSLVTTTIGLTHGVERINTIVLPPEQLAIANSKRLPDTNVTVLQFFKDNNPGIMIEDAFELTNVNPRPSGLGGSANCILAYKKDPTRLSLEIPQEFEQFPPQQRNLAYVVPCHARCGGVIVYRPLSIMIVEGI